MKTTISCLFRLALLLGLLGLSSVAGQAKSTPDQLREEIRSVRDKTLTDLYLLHPGAKKKIKAAAGYAVFTNVGINLIIASAAGGHGMVVEQGLLQDTETFMNMASVGLGLGLGVKDFRAVFIFSTKERLRTFVDQGWDLSGQADAAAKSDTKGGATGLSGTIIDGVEIYQITKNGLALQATVQGTKYWKDADLN